MGFSGSDVANILLDSGNPWYATLQFLCLPGRIMKTDRLPPAYYAARDQHEKGKASLRRVNGNVEGYDVEVEYAIIKNTILEERRELAALGVDDGSFKQLIHSYVQCFKGHNARRTLGAALPVCAQQLTGLSFLNTYASLFFRQSGFRNAFLITTILSMLEGIFSLEFTNADCYSDYCSRNFDFPHHSHRQIWSSSDRRHCSYSLYDYNACCWYPRFCAED